MQSDIIDYRNGKYQGPIRHKQRQGIGIFIDDDLTFYISHWHRSQLNGPTLIYLTHGKYMYGQWSKNQPQGLNIFRSGDTVLLSKFKNGEPTQKCLLIFQRQNFACILAEEEGEWSITTSGNISSHGALLQFINKLGFSVSDHYFSLTKFACTFSHGSQLIKIYPCLANDCYFGFINGLGIIFNSNNGVVSVGHHKNQSICQFGGKFDGTKSAEEGNFESQTVKYKRIRPVGRIQQIYQNIHKKSLHFMNEYIDSKAKVIWKIQELLKNKLNDVAQEGIKKKMLKSCANIDESLEYREYNEEQSMRVYQNRQKMYSPPKKVMGRSQSQNTIARDNNAYKGLKNRQITPEKKDRSAYLNLYHVGKSESKNPKEISLKKVHQLQSISIDRQNLSLKHERSIKNVDKPEIQLQSSFSRKAYLERYDDSERHLLSNKNEKDNEQEESMKSPTFKTLFEQIESRYKLNKKIPEKTIEVKNQQQNSGNKIKREKSHIDKPNSLKRPTLSPQGKRSPSREIAKPSYQDIQERRKRIMQSLSDFNVDHSPERPIFRSDYKVENIELKRQSKQSQFGYVPLSISNKINQRRQTPPKYKHSKGQFESNEKGFVRKINAKTNNQNYLQEKQIQKALKAKFNQDKMMTHEKSYQVSANKPSKQQNQSEIQPKIPKTSTETPQFQGSTTPSRQKKTYVYLFE